MTVHAPRPLAPGASPAGRAGPGAAGPGTARPLQAVLDAVRSGTSSLAEVEDRTGLSRDVVSGAVDHLVRLGRLSAATMAFGCPGGGCGTCASGSAGAPGCGAAAASTERRGPVLVTISVR